MKISLQKTTRLPRWPAWAIIIVTVWLGLAAAVHYSARALGIKVTMCLMKATTDLPCPTCGLTRGVDCIIHGRLLEGWMMNPFVFTILGAYGICLQARMVSARTVSVVLTGGEKILAGIVTVALVFVNWCYLVKSGV